MQPSPFVRRLAGIVGALAIAWTGSAVRARAADREVLVMGHEVHSVPPHDRVARELQAGTLDDLYAQGLAKGALCYDVITRGDVAAVLTQEQQRELFGDDSMSETTFRNLQRVVSAPYVATLVISRINDRYTIIGTVLDVDASRAFARASRSATREEDLVTLIPALGEELGRKLPCFVQVTGKRQIDLGKITQATSGRMGYNMALFHALAPMALGGEPTFTGVVTEQDTITFNPEISADETTMSGHASWKADLSAPVVTMASKEADGVIKRAPYHLSFIEDLSAPYDKVTRTAKFDEELSDRAAQSNGAGTADITLKDQLAAFGDLANGLSTFVQSLTGVDPSAQVRQQQAAQDPNMKLSPDLHHAVVTLPDPRDQDSAYFRLAFPVDLKKQDDTHLTGTDDIGTFDYVVRVTIRPQN